MVKSTPINQLPQGQNKLETYITPKHEVDFNNTQKAHDNFQIPIDTNNDMNSNNEDDISINEVMSELNNNKDIEQIENNRLQQQINELQFQLQQQKQINIPQAPSANIINENISNQIKLEQLQKKSDKDESLNVSWYEQISSSITTKINELKNDFKLFTICCVLFWIMSREKVNEILTSKLTFISQEKSYIINIIRTLLFGIILISLFKI